MFRLAKIHFFSYTSKYQGTFWTKKGLKTFRFNCGFKNITFCYLDVCRFYNFDFCLLNLECNKIPPTFATENQNNGIISYLNNDEKIFC